MIYNISVYLQVNSFSNNVPLIIKCKLTTAVTGVLIFIFHLRYMLLDICIIHYWKLLLLLCNVTSVCSRLLTQTGFINVSFVSIMLLQRKKKRKKERNWVCQYFFLRIVRGDPPLFFSRVFASSFASADVTCP